MPGRWRPGAAYGLARSLSAQQSNCARPEATVAGALGIRLGGPNDYFGQRVEKPRIGDAVRDIAVDDISRTIRLMWVASSPALALFIGVRYWLVGAA